MDHDDIGAVEASPTGRFLVTADASVTRLWDPTTGEEIRRFAGASPVALSPDCRVLATAIPGGSESKNGEIVLWDIGGAELGRLRGHTDHLWSLAFSADGRTLLSTANDSTVRSWNVGTRQEVWRYAPGPDADVSAAVSSPGGHYVAAGAKGGACLLRSADGKPLRRFQGHSNYTSSVDFSTDGKQLLTAISDPANHENRLVLWDVASGREVRRFEGYGSALRAATFSADGRFIGTASGNGMAHVWDLSRGTESRRLEASGHVGESSRSSFRRMDVIW
jgi:WD40 repeat protein